ncbi:ricin B-like lectin R40C1 [Tripterygium wilfordii]|uniref:ricin B-like lectin R40C1 n=1 Tax=Tripterygium wilfordii TaxID=458696 RepID=UPI0018F80A5C|nr:ricin B-like lectin R40C1 [Tripterygium wilfordii]
MVLTAIDVGFFTSAVLCCVEESSWTMLIGKDKFNINPPRYGQALKAGNSPKTLLTQQPSLEFLITILADATPSLVMATFRIFTIADSNFSLSVRNGMVILAPTNPNDPNQAWYKDERYAQGVMDQTCRKAFALINKGTGQAIKHATAHQPVRLVHFNPNCAVDRSLLWTKGVEGVEGNSPIWMFNNLDLAMDAEAANTEAFDGTLIKMWDWNGGINQQWSIVPNSPSPTMPTVRIFTMADPNFSLSIRDGNVILARTNPYDPNQEWYKNEKYAQGVNDQYRNAFALVNKGTGQAIKHATGPYQPVQLVHFNPNYVDNSLLWVKGVDWVEGHSPIWMLNNLELALDAVAANTKAYDGTLINMWKWNGGVNQLWSIVRY